jgi:hypothetical protein
MNRKPPRSLHGFGYMGTWIHTSTRQHDNTTLSAVRQTIKSPTPTQAQVLFFLQDENYFRCIIPVPPTCYATLQSHSITYSLTAQANKRTSYYHTSYIHEYTRQQTTRNATTRTCLTVGTHTDLYHPISFP